MEVKMDPNDQKYVLDKQEGSWCSEVRNIGPGGF